MAPKRYQFPLITFMFGKHTFMVSVPNTPLVSNVGKLLSHAEQARLFHISPGTFIKSKRQKHPNTKLI